MNKPNVDENIRIKVERVTVEGSGVIILTGPSSCGKGEIAKELRRFLSIPKERHLSMGDILRNTIYRARNDTTFENILSSDYGISNQVSIMDDVYNSNEIISKVIKNDLELKKFYNGQEIITQLDWLEFCVSKGLLIPDVWTVNIINATFEYFDELHNNIFILDGYPRTVKAAEELVNTSMKLQIPIIKVIHLSITKEEMIKRALGRKRYDDNIESLERRYNFYIEHVQPSIDYLKLRLGSSKVVLIDAHQPVYINENDIDVELSIKQVTIDVLQSLGLPNYLLNINS